MIQVHMFTCSWQVLNFAFKVIQKVGSVKSSNDVLSLEHSGWVVLGGTGALKS